MLNKLPMKRSVLVALILIVASPVTMAQHNSNQIDFKRKTIRTPRYRDFHEQGITNYQNNNSADFSQQQIVPEQKDNEVSIRCSVLMNVKADSYLAIFNLTQTGTTAKEADEIIAKRSQPFIDALKTLGIQQSDIYSDMIYLIPIYNYEMEKKLFSKTYNEVPKGFEMQKNLHIRFKDSGLIDDLVTLAAVNEIYDLVTIEYFVKDSQAVYDSMRTKAINYIARNMKKFEKLGLKVEGEFRVISEKSGVTYPDSQYSDYDAFVSQSIDAARDKTVTSIRKPKTVAYSKLSYDAFDLVINPEFLEPVVQYTYELHVNYTLNKDKLEPKNHYMIMDNNGNIKEIPLK